MRVIGYLTIDGDGRGGLLTLCDRRGAPAQQVRCRRHPWWYALLLRAPAIIARHRRVGRAAIVGDDRTIFGDVITAPKGRLYVRVGIARHFEAERSDRPPMRFDFSTPTPGAVRDAIGNGPLAN